MPAPWVPPAPRPLGPTCAPPPGSRQRPAPGSLQRPAPWAPRPPPTCDRVVALQSQGVVLAGAGAHQVEPAPAAGRREVADVLEGRADGRPGVREGVIALHLYHVQSGACRANGWGQGCRGLGRGKVPGNAGSEALRRLQGRPGCPGGQGQGEVGTAWRGGRVCARSVASVLPDSL